ncbi:MarR family winged helix-turn-helix transcriptional regulator [Tuberibacillus sp. Marseille-P3662]|uniref:MarR family winged helix-turn-helix transcriptional regulator n=1 Tax=Tuberibacillus sp. Marseille-P3662 TaxID=1965358 RepID=UPI0034E89682
MSEYQDPSLRLFIILSRTNKTIAELVRQDIKNQGLNPTEFAVLELLYHKGDQPIQKIGDRLLLASGSMTYVIDRLEGKGYLRRQPCPNDRRVTYAVITESGQTLMDDIFPKHHESLQRIFGGLSDEEKQQAADLLKKLSFNAEL